MKKILLFIFCVLSFASYSQTWQWAKKINSISTFNQNYIVADTSGNYYIATSYGCAYYYTCDAGITISKYNTNGLLIWSDTVIMSNPYPSYSIYVKLKIKNNNIYLTSHFENSVFVNDTSFIAKGNLDIIIIQYQLNGHIQKVKTIGGINEDKLNDIYIDDEQNMYLTGSFVNSCYFIPDSATNAKGRADLFVAKYNANGELTFFKQAWSTDTNYFSYNYNPYVAGTNLIVNNQDEIILSGSYNSGLVFDTIGDNFHSDENSAYFIFKIRENGITEELYYNKNTSFSYDYSNIQINDTYDFYLLEWAWYAHGGHHKINKYNNDGTITTLIATGSSDTHKHDINGFLFDDKENLFYLGHYLSPYGTDKMNMFYVAKNDTMNIQLWKDSIVNYNPDNRNSLTQLALDKLGDLFVIGYFKDTIVIANDTLISTSRGSWFVAKIIDTTASINANTPSEIQNPKSEIAIFPNPTSSTFTIITTNKEPIQITIYNTVGEKIMEKTVNRKQEILNLSSQPKGIYFIEIVSEGKKETRKIVLD